MNKQNNKLNKALLNYLEKSLEIMSITKCPYFIMEGYGAIYMDSKYINRNKIDINEEEKEKLKELTQKGKNEYIDERIDFIVKEIKNITKSMVIKNSKPIKDASSQSLKIGKTLDDLLNMNENKSSSNDSSNESLPEITKSQALEQVKYGQKTKIWETLNEIDKTKAKAKIEQSLKKEDDK